LHNAELTENKEILRDFVAETRDILDSVEPALLSVEKAIESDEPVDEEIIHEVFRGFHSIKGAAGFLELGAVTTLTHEAESLLDLIRKGNRRLEATSLNLLLEAVDISRMLIDHISMHERDDDMVGGVEDLSARLVAAREQAKNMPTTAPVPEGTGSDLVEIAKRLETVNGYLWGAGHQVDVGSREACLRGAAEEIEHAERLLTEGRYEEPVEIAAKLRSEIMRLDVAAGLDLERVGILQHLTDGLTRCIHELIGGRSSEHAFLLGAVLDDMVRIRHGEAINDETQLLLGQTLVNLGVISNQLLQKALRKQGDRPLGEILLEMKAIDHDQLRLTLDVQQQRRKALPERVEKQKRRNLRVDIDKLELLGDLVGELVIAENMVTHYVSADQVREDARKAVGGLSRITREIQDLVMSLRMVPLAGVFRKLTRVIRDVAQKTGKKVSVVLEGEDTEIDKNVIENLDSPLIHIVRNAVDHGLEGPSVRREAGKQDTGRVTLSARQEGGEVLIEISDDGRGIDTDSIVAKACEKGLIDVDQVPTSIEDIHELLFLPGLSTAAEVTDISGRGVGMDVVRQKIRDLQGNITVSSRQGRGTTFVLQIPLTLSIVESMMVRVGTTVLSIPLLNIRESLVASEKTITTLPDGSESIRLREELIPIIRLGDHYGIEAEVGLGDGVLIVVSHGRNTRGLLVDEILGQQQVVIKNVSPFLGEVKTLAGFSILEDGGIALVVDIATLVL